MTVIHQIRPSLDPVALAGHVEAACNRIAPAWPLDRMIAVNPWWGLIDRPIADAAAEVTALSGGTMLMAREWYREQWRQGRLTPRHLREAIAAIDPTRAVAEVERALLADAPSAARWARVTDALDVGRDLGHGMSWEEFVVRQVSPACAACLDAGQARWAPGRGEPLYQFWRELALHDRGPRLLMGVRRFREAVALLPATPRELVGVALTELEIPTEAIESYLQSLLLSVQGWAALTAQLRWEARLAGRDDDRIEQLLAVRLAWELLLHRLGDTSGIADRWADAKAGWHGAVEGAAEQQRDDWILQRAAEFAYQEELARQLGHGALPPARPACAVQAVFCIDVRSEVFRRHLEATGPDVETLGFAGFFGLPIAYRAPLGAPRPQVPGLLIPSLLADQGGAHGERVRGALAASLGWKELASDPLATFPFVETIGLGWFANLLRDGLGRSRPSGDVLQSASGARGAADVPRLTTGAEGDALDDRARVTLAAGVLRGMSLVRDLAPLVAFIGHGASTENNPQAAGLHCGACGGQTGEVNARVLAALLNDPAVRAGLRDEGIDLGATRFLAGLHDTTTDSVTLLDIAAAPTEHRQAIAAFQDRLVAAGHGARRERAAALGITAVRDEELARRIRARATDWSEVRPEWGLAGNAAFIAAPRERTRGTDLGGRAFLHEYRWELDPEGSVLEAIMTAPMVVAHWINMQYHASTVDPERQGSGDKVLHNVVGGHLGVMEGAGGDLRIGLAKQSVHDGERWMHEPLRLSVVIEAPQAMIERVIARHDTVRHLVEHQWLFLHRIDPADGRVRQRRAGRWLPLAAEGGSA